MNTYKTAKTIKEYSLTFKGWPIVVPIGSTVSNSTALGYDDRSRFWQDWHDYAAKLTGFKNSILAHDLTYYGINIPRDHCEPYKPL